MKVKLIAEVSYRVETETGVSLPGVYSRESEWEGMMKLASENHTLLVEAPNWIERMFGQLDSVSGSETAVEVVKASPDLLVAIQNGKLQPQS